MKPSNTEIIEQVRYACPLGALQSVLAIERAAPILHCGPGCGQKLWTALSNSNGFQGSGYTGGHSVACTNCTEKDIIFGGNDKLHRVIENSLNVIDADLYVVLTGCTADIIGDDIGAVVGDFQKKGEPIAYAETGGFKGDNFLGHELVIDAIVSQLLDSSSAVEPKLVNVWATVPYFDAFWAGNYRAIGKLLRLIGLTPNIIFGQDGGMSAIQRIPQAQFNLLISPWIGLRNMHTLQKRFGTPFLHYNTLPIGPTETGKFLREVGSFAGIDSNVVEQAITAQEHVYDYFIERTLDYLTQSRSGIPSRFVHIADSFYALGISKFLVSDLGFLPGTQYITDNVPPKFQKDIRDAFTNLSEEVSAPVVFSTDGGAIQEEIAQTKFYGRPLILGSGWDTLLAQDLHAYQLSVSFPVSNRFVLDKSYVGYSGALRLTEDIFSSVVSANYLSTY